MRRSFFAAKRSPLFIVFLLSVVILALSSHFIWTGQLNTYGLGHTLNDQVGYITASRNLVEHGKLESSLYYPALVPFYKTHNILYMPGIFYVRALFFWLFGYSLFSTFLPSFLAYIGSGITLFAIAHKLYDQKTAYISSLVLLLFPPFVLYAFTAMMETFFVFAWLLFFYIFISLPLRKRHIWGPLLLMLPYLIRESALLAIPGLAAMIMLDGEVKPRRRALIFVGISACLIIILKHAPIISGLPPLFLARFMRSSAVYGNALVLHDLHISPMVLFTTFLKNLFANIVTFLDMLLAVPSWSIDFFFFVMVICLFAAVLMMKISSRPEARALWYFTSFTVAATFAVIFSMYGYFVERFNGIRQLLYMFPFLVCVITDALLSGRLPVRKSVETVVIVLFFLSYIVFGINTVNNFHGDLVQADRYAAQGNAFLDSLGVAKTTFFVSPHTIALDYVNVHYPIRWSFIPDNEETLKLLAEKYPIGILIIPIGHPLTLDFETGRIKSSLLNGAFRFTESRIFHNTTYLIYRPMRK